MPPLRVLSLLLLYSAGCSTVSCLYLYMGETDTKCFIQDMADNIKVVGKYRMNYKGRPSGPQSLAMVVEVKDPDKKLILSRLYGSEGSFTFTSHTPGQHYICLCSNSSSLALFSEAMLVHLDIQVERKKSFSLTDLQFKVQKLTEQVYKIQEEKDYQRYREQCFRQTSESTLQRVKSSIVYTLIGLFALAFWKTRTLKSLNFIEAEESEKSAKPDIFINVKPKELILPKWASSNVSYVQLQ